jgi:hypothetical protein
MAVFATTVSQSDKVNIVMTQEQFLVLFIKAGCKIPKFADEKVAQVEEFTSLLYVSVVINVTK